MILLNKNQIADYVNKGVNIEEIELYLVEQDFIRYKLRKLGLI